MSNNNNPDWANYYALKKLYEEKYDEIMRLEDKQLEWEECLKTGYWQDDQYLEPKTKMTEEDRKKILGYLDGVLREIGQLEDEQSNLWHKYYELEKKLGIKR